MIKIVTDTQASLPQEVIDRYQIPLTAQVVVFGEDEYREIFDMSVAEFYTRLTTTTELPHTSAPSPGEFEVIFERILKDTPDATILVICPSSEVSGTIRAAIPAAGLFPEADIQVFDTRSASLGQGLMVLEAARMAERGAALPDIMARLEEMRDHMNVRFIVNTLEYLARGGRIGKAAHLFGSMLDIKPVLALHNGVVESHAKYRSHKKAVEAIVEEVVASAGDKPGLHLAILHAACETEAHALMDTLCARLSPELFLMGELSPAVGVHVGPGTLGVCWWTPPCHG